jgi:hypothetical protein
VAFTELECDTLLDIVAGSGGVVPAAISMGAGGGKDIRAFLDNFEASAESLWSCSLHHRIIPTTEAVGQAALTYADG